MAYRPCCRKKLNTYASLVSLETGLTTLKFTHFLCLMSPQGSYFAFHATNGNLNRWDASIQKNQLIILNHISFREKLFDIRMPLSMQEYLFCVWREGERRKRGSFKFLALLFTFCINLWISAIIGPIIPLLGCCEDTIR